MNLPCFHRILAALALLATMSCPALAEEGPAPADSSPARQAQARDASIDRGFLTSHAETIGEGKWAINAYQLVFLGVTYGFSDDFQVSLSTLVPITTDIPLVLALQPKLVLARTPDTIVALRLPFTYTSVDNDALGLFGAGLVVDHYFGSKARIAIHGGLLVSGVFGDIDFGAESDGLSVVDGAVFELDLGASFGVSNAVKIIVEAQIFATASDAGFEVSEAALINYGVRIHGAGLAGDLGLVRPIGVDTGSLLLGVPYVAISARF